MSASFQQRGLKGIIKIPVVLFYLESDISKVVCQLKLYVCAFPVIVAIDTLFFLLSCTVQVLHDAIMMHFL